LEADRTRMYAGLDVRRPDVSPLGIATDGTLA
jgi:hypothetical protein